MLDNGAMCEVCGKGPEACAFEVACSCWYGVPCVRDVAS
jgi:hypothetical protein